MITNELIEDYINKVPPAPKVLQVTMRFLANGELVKAAQIAQQDLALKTYLINIVNKPIYGFKNKVSDVSQIFGILGVSSSQQTVRNYMTSLLSPDKWNLFDLNTTLFQELQARLSRKWNQILQHLNIVDVDIESAITLLPASIIVAEALFNEKKDDVNLLRGVNEIDLNTILSRLCGVDIFDICEKISIKWEMPQQISQIVYLSSGVRESNDEKINRLGKWMHLLLFYELSQPIFIESGLNDFIEFNPEFISDIYDDFIVLMEIS